MLARALAESLSAGFFCISGPELLTKYVGESESKLRDIFRNAKNFSEETGKKKYRIYR